MPALLVALVTLWLPGASASIHLAPDPDHRTFAERPELAEPVPIGSPGDYKDYYRIDRGCPLRIRGRGELRFYVRAHVPAEGAEPESVAVTLTGLEGFPIQRWWEEVAVSPVSIFGDDRSGLPTGGEKITLLIPPGVHEITVTGTSDTGDPVYAIFYYDGPPVEKPKPKPPPSPWDVSADFLFDVIYDDNVAHYSKELLAEFRSGARPERYAIETEDDLIMSPTIQTEISHRNLLFGKRTRLRLRYRRWDYMSNPIKTNEDVQIRLRQDTRRHDFLEASYTYAPFHYIKELSDRPPFTSLDVPREYLHFEIASNSLGLSYRWWVNPWLDFEFSGARKLRFYNRPFLENDLWEWEGIIRSDIEYRRFTFRLQYEYSDVEARGYDEVGETLETSDNDSDGSYQEDAYRLRVTYRPGKDPFEAGADGGSIFARTAHWARRAAALLDRTLISLRTYYCYIQYTCDRRFYTSDRPLYIDPLHVGRMDENKQWRAVWSSRQLYKRIRLEFGMVHTVRRADGPAVDVGEDDPSEEKNYIGTRYWVSFDVPLR